METVWYIFVDIEQTILVEDNILKLINVFLINSLKFSLDTNGSITEIETIKINAYKRKKPSQKETTSKKSNNSPSWGDKINKVN